MIRIISASAEPRDIMLNNYSMMLTFNKKYFALTILLFTIEVLIALFVNDNFIRPYLGDVLVVILIYCFIKTFLRLPSFPLAMFVLVFSFSIEVLQYFDIIKRLGLEKSKIARIIIGTSFVWIDFLAYTAGIAMVLGIEKYLVKKKSQGAYLKDGTQ